MQQIRTEPRSFRGQIVRDIKYLAQKFGVGTTVVAAIYLQIHAKIKKEAKVSDFVSLITVRETTEILKNEIDEIDAIRSCTSDILPKTGAQYIKQRESKTGMMGFFRKFLFSEARQNEGTEGNGKTDGSVEQT